MALSRNEVARMIREQIARTLLRATDTLKPDGALAGEVVIDPAGGLTQSPTGLAVDVDLDDFVVGPSSAVDLRIAVFGATTGKLIKDNGAVFISAFGELNGGSIVNAMISLANVLQHIRPLVALTYNDPGARTGSTFQKIGNTGMSGSEGFVMPYAGSIRAHSVSVDLQLVTSGDVIFQAKINNSNQVSLEVQFLASLGLGPTTAHVTVSSGSVTFVAGDVIQMKAAETGTMGWDDVMGTVWVEFDP